MQKWQLPNFINTLGETIEKIEKDNFKGLEAGETYLNQSSRHILYKVTFYNALGVAQSYYDILKPTESITKTNPVNKIQIYI